MKRMLWPIGFLVPLLLATFAVAPAASAGVGSSTLQPYLVSNPIGGAPLPSSYLDLLAQTEAEALSTVFPGSLAAAEGWSNSRLHAEFFDVLVTTGAKIGNPTANAKEFVTAACGSAGGGASQLQKIRGLDGGQGYQTTCQSRVKSSNKVLEIICLVKADVLDGFFADLAPRFPLRSLDALAIRQSRLIPAAGI